MTKEEKARAKAGEDAKDIWPDNPAKASRKDTNARWVVKYSKARKTKTGEKDAGLVDIPVPRFGYKNHISIDRKWRFIRGETTTDAARHDGLDAAPGVSWTRIIPGPASGRTALTDRNRTRLSWNATALSAMSITASPKAGRCQSTSVAATTPDRNTAPRSSMSSLSGST